MTAASCVTVIAATGRVGMALARRLVADGVEVIAVGRDSAKLARLPVDCEKRIADLADPVALRAALADARIVVICTNAQFVPAILAALPPSGVERIVATGSTRRFSQAPDATAEAVRQAEALLAAVPVPSVVLLATLIYGAGGSVVDKLAGLIRRCPILPLPGGGRSLLQPIHVEDVAASLAAAAFRAEAPGPPIVIAGPTAMAYADMVRAAARAAGRTVLILPVPTGLVLAAAALAGRVPRLAGLSGALRRLVEDKAFDISAMRVRLGISPRPFRIGLLLLGLLGAAGGAAAASLPAVEARHGMVVSANRLASEAGVRVLRMGGNAVDAAVAVGYALAVVDPCCGNLGGGGFMTIHLADGRETVLNFRETAPAAARADMYLDARGTPRREASLEGYLAVAVPGTVRGLDRALAAYGRLPRGKVMAAAIDLAKNGFVLARADTDILAFGNDRFAGDPAAAKIFLRPDGSPWRPGDRLIQTDLAATLALIAAGGPDAFYRGPIAQRIVAASRDHGGILSLADLSGYTAAEAAPLKCSYRGYEIMAPPPPSSGGTAVCEILNILSGYDMPALGFRSAKSVHLTVEAMRQAYRDRNMLLGDPAFVSNPLDRLLSPDYAAQVRGRIAPSQATPSDRASGTGPAEKAETTHYSVVDGAGNAVAVTYTLNGAFGAKVIAPGTGFFLNDEMDDFTVKPGTANLYGLVQEVPNAIAPGKRPLSSMAPTIVTRRGKPFLVLGSPGGPRIISAVVETLTNIIDDGMAPQQAVDAPRLHHQWLPDEIFYEPFGLSPDTRRILADTGYTMVEQRAWGAVELIEIGDAAPAADMPASPGHDAAPSGAVRPGYLYGASDPRRPAGAAMGY